MTIFIAILALVILLQAAYIRQLERGGFGAFSRAAILVRLAVYQLLKIPCGLVALDMRKMHEMNAVLGYEILNQLVARIIKTSDIRGQFGGDEIVILIPYAKTGTARLIKNRIIRNARMITNGLPDEKRQELCRRTAGLVDGVHVAILSVDSTRNPLRATWAAMDILERMKEDGADVTGVRATTGNVGTLQADLDIL